MSEQTAFDGHTYYDFLEWQQMKSYRVFRLDARGQVDGRAIAVLEASSDDEALVGTKEYLGDADLEVWEGTRKIGRLKHRTAGPLGHLMEQLSLSAG